MKNVKCSDCAFFDDTVQAPHGDAGACRCHAPHPEYGHPFVHPIKDWCGEFVAHPAATDGPMTLPEFDAWLKIEIPSAVTDFQVDDDALVLTGTIYGGVEVSRRWKLILEKLGQTGMDISDISITGINPGKT